MVFTFYYSGMTKIITPISFIFEISKSLNLKIFIDYKRNLELESRKNGLGKPFREKPDKKYARNQTATWKEKATIEKTNFCSNSFWNWSEKNDASIPLASTLKSFFGVDVAKIIATICLLKWWKCVNRSLIKSTTQCNYNSFKYKKQNTNAIASYWYMKAAINQKVLQIF